LKIAAAQIRPVWLNKPATVAKVIETIKQAAAEKIDLLAFPEAFVSGYPFWLCFSMVARRLLRPTEPRLSRRHQGSKG
jgi:predicted amidohydrolase